MEFVAGVLAGGVAGVVIERLLGRPFDRFVVSPIAERYRHRRLAELSNTYQLNGEQILIGDHNLFVRQFAPGGFRRGDLLGTYDGEHSLKDRYEQSSIASDLVSYDVLESEIAAEADRLDQDPHQWNGQKVALRSVAVSRTVDVEEVTLQMQFVSADHATMSAIGRVWLEAHRGHPNRILTGDQLRSVDPLLSNSFGMNATVETADGFLVVTRRGAMTSGWHGRWHTSVNEGVGPMDILPGGRVDLVESLLRGLREELGVEAIDTPDLRSRVNVHTLVLEVDLYEWALLAHIDLRNTDWTASEIRAARGLGSAHDDWEASELRFVPFGVASALAECRQQEAWIPHGLLNVVSSTALRYPADAAALRQTLLTRT